MTGSGYHLKFIKDAVAEFTPEATARLWIFLIQLLGTRF